jgi:hypothetical protein
MVPQITKSILTTPTGSISAESVIKRHTGINGFPSQITENIYYCSFSSEKSFGARSYLIVRPEEKGVNVLIG